MVLHVPGEYDTVFETAFKTEFLTVLTKKYEADVGKTLTLDFRDKYGFHVFHTFFSSGLISLGFFCKDCRVKSFSLSVLSVASRWP